MGEGTEYKLLDQNALGNGERVPNNNGPRCATDIGATGGGMPIGRGVQHVEILRKFIGQAVNIYDLWDI